MIREATPDDDAALYGIYRDAVRSSGPHYTPAQARAWVPSDVMEPWWSERLRPGTTWIAEQDGVGMGFITLTDAHLDFFFVTPAVRGQGVASALYAHLERVARDRDLDALTTYASLFLRPILEAKGWHVTETQDVERHGEILRRYAMRKDLRRSDSRRQEVSQLS